MVMTIELSGLQLVMLFCLTLKHHPIVFSMGNGVPCVGIVFDAYYRHKNSGALGLFDMQDWLLDTKTIFGVEAIT